MVKPDRFDAVVRSVYDAAVNPFMWGDALSRIAASCQADNIHLMAWDPAQPNPSFSLAPGMEESMETRYRAHYGAIDPRRLLVAQRPDGDWMACAQHFDTRAVGRSEFFQDYLIPGGCRYLLGTRLVRHAGHDVFLGMHRAPGRRPFRAGDLQFVARMTAYLQHASRLWLDTEELRTRAAQGQHALDAAELAVFSTDPSGRLAYANPYAEALLREGTVLCMRSGRLAAESKEGQDRLRLAMRHAAVAGGAQSLRLDAAGSQQGAACYLTVLAVGDAGPLRQRLHPARLLVLARHTAHRRLPTVQQLVAIFGMSPAQAWLARSLGAGMTLDDCARANGVSLNTVKRQLQDVFAKAGVSRQAELVRHVAAVPVVRDRRGRWGGVRGLALAAFSSSIVMTALQAKTGQTSHLGGAQSKDAFQQCPDHL